MSDWATLHGALGLTIRPIDVWPGKSTTSRERGPFTAPLKDTLRMLKFEMSELRAKNIVLQIAIREGDLRLDGLPRAAAIATHPGIILAFDSRHGALRLHFDGFSRWEFNLRAIAMHLQHLRMAGLYGVGRDAEQYRGWLALPPPASDQAAKEEAARVIVQCAGVDASAAQQILLSGEARDDYYRRAVRCHHPDAGGDNAQFVRLQQAMAVLRGKKST